MFKIIMQNTRWSKKKTERILNRFVADNKKAEVYVMYINEFWCGVIATILVEVLAVFTFAYVSSRKDDDEE